MSWDPKQYLKYSNERLRPAQDLLARVPGDAPRTIVDLGCGAGNVTALLADRWPHARITGVDNSSEMLAKARASTAGDARFEWIEADIATWAPSAPVDVVYSNAALHWQDDHARLFPRLFDWVAPGGVLAVQMPDNFAAPSHTAIAEVVATPRWRDRLGALAAHLAGAAGRELFSTAGRGGAGGRVDDGISACAAGVDRRCASGGRVGERHDVDAVPGGARCRRRNALSSDDVSARVAAAYPALPDGRVLFAFRRVFVVASRAIR